ncbi:MAG: hypothetical protein ACI8ZM_005234 [Crocinitomix sp.]|jgi:hypothetical protein
MVKNKPVHESEYIVMELKDGILHCSYPKDLIVTMDVARVIVDERREYTKGIPYPALIDMSGIKNAKMDAMKYWASEESYVGLSKIAIVSNKGLVSKILINFWFKIDKPFKPTKFFKDEGTARIFLMDLVSN